MTVKITANGLSALNEFTYRNGYTLTVTDMGSDGLRIELIHPYENTAAVIIPPDKALMCVHWMLKTLALQEDKLPAELPEILRRIVDRKSLNRGDKKKIRNAIRTLRDWQSD